MTLNRRWMLIPGVLALLPVLYFFRAQIGLTVRLLVGGGIIAYLFCPLSKWFSRRFRMNRTWSIACSFLTAVMLIALIVVLFLPPLVSQMRELIAAVPGFMGTARRQISQLNRTLSEKGFGRLSLPEFDWENALSSIPPLLGGTASLAGSLVSRFTEWTLIFMLAYYFLRDRERLALHLELMVPSAFRRMAVRMASEVHHEIGAYLRGQLLISAMVAALSAIALLIAGVRSYLALGLIVGLFNLIPYFGPILGAVPAVLMALAQSPFTALMAALALFAVQQADSMIISPRVMGTLTGLHPAWVLLTITLGSSLMGVAGMFLAIPMILTVRAAARVWVAREAVN